MFFSPYNWILRKIFEKQLTINSPQTPLNQGVFMTANRIAIGMKYQNVVRKLTIIFDSCIN